MEHQKHNKLIVIGNLYRPPQGDVDLCIQYLESAIDNFEMDRIELFLMGDFNIDFLDKKDPSHLKLYELIKPLGLCQLIKEPTRLTLNRSSCLDLFITNCDNICKSGVCTINISDHLPILLTSRKIKMEKRKCSFKGWSYRRYDKNLFQQKIMEAKE